MAKAKDALFLS